MNKKSKTIKRLRAEIAQLKDDLHEVLDNPNGGRAQALRLLRLLQGKMQERWWYGTYRSDPDVVEPQATNTLK